MPLCALNELEQYAVFIIFLHYVGKPGPKSNKNFPKIWISVKIEKTQAISVIAHCQMA
jgi:hypothetical protein